MLIPEFISETHIVETISNSNSTESLTISISPYKPSGIYSEDILFFMSTFELLVNPKSLVKDESGCVITSGYISQVNDINNSLLIVLRQRDERSESPLSLT